MLLIACGMICFLGMESGWSGIILSQTLESAIFFYTYPYTLYNSTFSFFAMEPLIANINYEKVGELDHPQ